jgi:hypothetical protein
MRNGIFAGLVLAIWCVFPAATNAQNFASVTGTVTDTSGAAVVDANVTLLNTGTNASYAAKTGENGAYRIADIPPGPGHSLTVKKDGFEIFVVNNLYLPVATTTTQDVQLKLGTVQQKVEVTAEGSVTLNTTDTSIGNTFDMRTIESLPNEFRDDPGQLLRLEAGVVSAQTPRGNPSNDPNFSRDGSVAGARADQDNIIVDGIDATDFAFGVSFQTQAAIPVEAIQEFNTLVADPTPAYGGRSGAQTIITTKSGSNTWHGSAYEFNRTAATEANTYFNNQIGVPRLGLERNQFGANLGGAAVKDKLFFFFEYDGRRDNSAQAVDQLVRTRVYKQYPRLHQYFASDLRRCEHKLRDNSFCRSSGGARPVQPASGLHKRHNAGLHRAGRCSLSAEPVQDSLPSPQRLLRRRWN